MIDLTTLGWDAERQRELEQLALEELLPARASIQHRGAYDVLAEAGELRCEVLPRVVREAASPSELPVVGDWVAFAPSAAGRGTIHAVLSRRTAFSRLAAHDAASSITREQVVAANIDVVFIVTSLNEDLNLRRVERYLTLAKESGARPVVLLTKADLIEDSGPLLAAVEAIAGNVPVHAVSVRTGVGIDVVRSYIGPRLTAALLGSSGVGKSTIVNALLGEERLETQEIRRDGKGRHTTIRRELLVLPGGGLLVDTPGMRELQLWTADQGLEETFTDVTSLFSECRFADCSHASEPGCAVLAALGDGRLAAERWASFRKLEEELVTLERRLEARAAAEARRRPHKPGSSRRT